MRAVQAFAIALCLAAPFVLSACGGGGGDGTPTAAMEMPEPTTPEPTTPAPTPAPPSNASLEPLAALQNILGNANAEYSESAAGLARFGGYNDGFLLIGRGHQYTVPYQNTQDHLNNLFGLYEISLPSDRLLSIGTIFSSEEEQWQQMIGAFDLSDDKRISANNLERYTTVFNRDYAALEKFDNTWDGISTARTKEICYVTPESFHAGGGGPCGADALANPEDFLRRERLLDPSNPNHVGIQYRNSAVAYLEYSAFFLNRALQIQDNVRGYYPTRELYEAALAPDNIWHSNFAGFAASTGQLTPNDQRPPPTGTWNGQAAC